MPPDPLLRLLPQLAEPFTGEALFDCLPDLVFFMKDERARYVAVNRTLAERLGVAGKESLLGRTAAEVFPPPLGAGYLAQDLDLIRSGTPLHDELERHAYPSGETGWCLTTKLPLRDRDGHCVGLVGISKDLHSAALDTPECRQVAAALRYAREHLAEPLGLDELARIAGLSPYRFDHRIREMFRLPLGRLLLKFRMDLAVRRLRHSVDPIAGIALDCGYSDQSAFTRQFRRTIGLSPSRFRKGAPE